MYLDSRVPVNRALVVHAMDFRLRVNLQKTRVHGCVHAIHVILNTGTVRASIKFKSSCTVAQFQKLQYTETNIRQVVL